MKTRSLLLALVLCVPVQIAFAGDLEDGIAAYGRGDYQTAHSSFLKAAEQGRPSTQGLDNPDLWRSYQIVAERGNVDAMFALGWLYANGRGGVPQDDREAVKWYRAAAERAHADAQAVLGMMYYRGRGVSQDYAEAARWIRKAAEQGHSAAQGVLGAMYANGRGVPQDYVHAHKWYNVSGANGDEDGQKNRDIVAEEMTPAQIAEAQRLAREWMEKQSK